MLYTETVVHGVYDIIMRKTCVDCALKHLSQAAILLQESKQGYPQHLHYARGHMAEAEAELISRYPKHAEMVRNERKRLEENNSYKPKFDDLIKHVDRECDVCDLKEDTEKLIARCVQKGTSPKECRLKYAPKT